MLVVATVVAGLLLLSCALVGCGPPAGSHTAPHSERHRHPHCHGVDGDSCHEHRHGAGHHQH
jgi:hypothetical protein